MGSRRSRLFTHRRPADSSLSERIATDGPSLDPQQAAIEWAYRFATDPRTLYLDTETTGLDAGAEVVDLAVVASDGRILLETLIRPSRQIPSDASAIHGIYAEHVADAPTWPVIHERLHDLLVDRPVVVYNAPFDRRMVEQCCRRHGLATPSSSWECAMRRFAAFHGDRTQRGGFRSHKLEFAVTRFGARPGGHRAAADALACRSVVHGMAAGFATDVESHSPFD